MLALAIVLVLIALIMVRVPVSFAILAAGLLGLTILGGPGLAVTSLETAPLAAVRNNSLSAVPLFILMAHLLLISRLLDNLFDAARAVVGRLPGGTAIASIGAGTAFAAVSGSSTASAATLAQTSSARMIREGYSRSTATGLVAVVGTLAAMIPPSIILVFYAITAEAPVGKVLIAGLFPGLLIAAVIGVTLYVTFFFNRSAVPAGEATSWGDKARLVGKSLPLGLVFLVVIGMIFFGLATPTESAALGVIAALILVLVTRTWDTRKIGEAILDTVKTSAMIFTIIIAAHVLGHFLTETRVTPALVAAAGQSGWPPLVIMLLIAAIYVVLGFFMDQIAIIALTVPVTLPIVTELGYDPIWFGIFVIVLAEVGMVTPPMGLNVFVVAKSLRINPMVVFRGAFPYVVAILALSLIFLLFPELVMWVPDLAG